ncbi:MAG: FAD-dependent monooxygenase [Acidobacteriaceae bacterium]
MTLDAIIVGGGPAGAALGTLLARSGRSVEIIEKTSGPHDKVCGEFLSDEAIQYLHNLGIDPVALGATLVSRVRLARRGLLGECALPFTGMSLTRRVLDEALLLHARKAGATVTRGARVRSLRRAGSAWIAQLANGDERRAPAAFLATGKHDLHGWARPAGKQSDLVAFKMYYRLARFDDAAMAHRVELVLFPGGYAGLLLSSEGTMNLCLLIKRSAIHRCGGQWPNVSEHLQASSPYLARLLAGATPLLDKPLALASIPYGYLCGHSSDGLWRVGDQAAVIPSFSGDGVSIALHSAHLAAAAYLRGQTADDFQQRLRLQLQSPVDAATRISRLMVAAPRLAAAVRIRPQILTSITERTRIPRSALLSAFEDQHSTINAFSEVL